MARASMSTKAINALKVKAAETPEWKIVFLRRGGYLSGALVMLQFVGMWAAALLDKPSPTNQGLIWGLIFLPVLIPLAVISPEALTALKDFVTAILGAVRNALPSFRKKKADEETDRN